MTALKVLFVGGSGQISSACSRRAVDLGIDLYVLNRGRTSARPLPAEAHRLEGDIRDPASAREAIGDREFDAVVDCVAFTPEHVQARRRPVHAGAPGSTSSSARPRPTRRRRRACRSSSRRRCATRSGSTRATRSPARTCWCAPTATTASRSRSCGPRTPTTARWCRSTAAGPRSTACAAASRSSSTATARRCGRSPTTPTSPGPSSACSATRGDRRQPSTSPPTTC